MKLENKNTTNGWESFSRIFFSFSIWSTCLLWIISAFFIVFIAYFIVLLLFNQPTLTLPKAPKYQMSFQKWMVFI
jgi:hypothetical protein